jgi:hypothetical protein
MFLLGGVALGGAGFGGSGDASIWIEAAKGTVAFLEDATTFLEEGLDLVDELFFVEFLFGGAVGFFNVLFLWLVRKIKIDRVMKTYLGDLFQDGLHLFQSLLQDGAHLSCNLPILLFGSDGG